jgi:hypothetical protein
MNDRLRKFMEALSLLAKQSDEPETQLTMEARMFPGGLFFSTSGLCDLATWARFKIQK